MHGLGKATKYMQVMNKKEQHKQSKKKQTN